MRVFDEQGRNLFWEETGRVIQKVGVRAARKTKNELVKISDGIDKYPQLANVFFQIWKAELRHTVPEDLYVNKARHELAKSILQALHERSGGVSTGYAVAGRFIGYCVLTAQRLQETNGAYTPQALATQITDETTIEKGVLPLARMANDFNKQYEEALGFIDDTYMFAARERFTPLQSVVRPDGSRYFQLNQILIMQTVGSEVAGASTSYTAEHPTETCPAQRFIPFLVRQIVDTCVDDPRYFAQDLVVPSVSTVQ